jgi:hypothetical protein
MTWYLAMLTLAVLGFLTGAVLGARFHVFAVFPTTLASIIIGAVAVAGGERGFWPVLGEVVIAVTALQVGFLAGTAIRCYFRLPAGTNQNAAPAARTPTTTASGTAA